MWTLRPCTADDMPQINEIVNYYIRETTANWSWEERPFEEAMVWFDNHKLPYHPVYVIEENGMILAYGSLSHFRPRAGYWPVAENSVYTRPDCKGHGLGTVIMNKLIEHAKSSGLRVITAWISDDNPESIRFHEKLGFYHTGRMPGIGEKFGRRLGVVIMQMDINTGGENNEQGIC